MNCKISEDEINILSKVSKLSLQNVFSSTEILKKNHSMSLKISSR